MDWTGDKLSMLIERALGTEVVVMSEAKEDEESMMDLLVGKKTMTNLKKPSPVLVQ